MLASVSYTDRHRAPWTPPHRCNYSSRNTCGRCRHRKRQFVQLHRTCQMPPVHHAAASCIREPGQHITNAHNPISAAITKSVSASHNTKIAAMPHPPTGIWQSQAGAYKGTPGHKQHTHQNNVLPNATTPPAGSAQNLASFPSTPQRNVPLKRASSRHLAPVIQRPLKLTPFALPHPIYLCQASKPPSSHGTPFKAAVHSAP